MKRMLLYVAAPTLILATSLQSQQGAAPEKKVDTSSHTVGFVTVETGVKLEVLDWGGTGPALIFLAGSGFDAHSFDTFAPRFTRDHHVYGITRRGFGASSAPAPVEGTYSADRLADDVLAVMTDLKLVRPVLVGHSLAGEELSSIGTRFPEKISGLIYLDAGYSYAFYSPPLGDPVIDAIDLKRKLDLLVAGRFGALSDFEELQKDSDQFSRDLQVLIKQRSLMPAPPPRPANAPGPSPIGVALGAGRQKFGAISVPILAIYADPHEQGGLYANDPQKKAVVLADDQATTSAQADAFQAAMPSARVIRIPNANHFVFRSNEAEVVRDMNTFLETLH